MEEIKSATHKSGKLNDLVHPKFNHQKNIYHYDIGVKSLEKLPLDDNRSKLIVYQCSYWRGYGQKRNLARVIHSKHRKTIIPQYRG